MATNKLKQCKIALQMIFICNPLSMFVLNLFAPAKAAAFAHREEFSPLMADVCSFLSYWLPWRWKKHWMVYENLADYQPAEQCRFFLTYSAKEETLKAMSEEARQMLWSITTKDSGKPKDKMLRVIEVFIRALPRLQDEQVPYLLDINRIYLFKMYIRHGTIRYVQVKMLVHAAVYGHPTLPQYTPTVGNGGPESGLQRNYTAEDVALAKADLNLKRQMFLNILTDYVRQHGIKPDVFAYIAELKAGTLGEEVSSAIRIALLVHEQRAFTVSHRKPEMSAIWRTYCEQQKNLCFEAQIWMTPAQYDVYHSTNHTLLPDAIAHYVRKGNLDMCRKIFLYEPEYGFVSEEIAHLVHANRDVETVFYQILQAQEKNA